MRAASTSVYSRTNRPLSRNLPEECCVDHGANAWPPWQIGTDEGTPPFDNLRGWKACKESAFTHKSRTSQSFELCAGQDEKLARVKAGKSKLALRPSDAWQLDGSSLLQPGDGFRCGSVASARGSGLRFVVMESHLSGSEALAAFKTPRSCSQTYHLRCFAESLSWQRGSVHVTPEPCLHSGASTTTASYTNANQLQTLLRFNHTRKRFTSHFTESNLPRS